MAPSGNAWNQPVKLAAEQRLKVFQTDWDKWLRGDVRVKKDGEVTVRDIENHHLVLFGDPGSNTIIAQVLGQLPLTWTKEQITLGGQSFAAADHLPVLIYPNPLNPKKYVVLNSGHSFGESAFKGTNALLFPRLGDFAVLKLTGEVALHGLFDERWNPLRGLGQVPIRIAPACDFDDTD